MGGLEVIPSMLAQRVKVIKSPKAKICKRL
jgi:hypothetical protein